ncbi:uncharacterized protein LOC101238924 [Hydra vulgaris]|uniref:uncharacterized protein LOC101238924 n=1 Tax=Hydra vulgaris TaxID=6087 RepID=UPI0002B4360D|nr:uncharacterized protein LOC101238924 [Hydra vulgaris]
MEPQHKNILEFVSTVSDITSEENHNEVKCESSFIKHRSVEQDELLANAVKNFPCLYDNKHVDYKNSEARQNAWNYVAGLINLRCGDDACRLFETLKKRYSRKKVNFKKAHHQSYSENVIKKTQEDFLSYNFMHWLEPYIRFRSIKGTFLPNKVLHADQSEETSDSNNDETNLASRHTSSISYIGKRQTDLFKGSTPTKIARNNKTQFSSPLQASSFPLAYSNTASNDTGACYQGKVINDEDDLFTTMLLTQLRKLNDDQKCIVKHEINNIVYKAMLNNIEHKKNES